MSAPTKAAYLAALTELGVRYHDHTDGTLYLGPLEPRAITIHDSVSGWLSDDDENAVNYCRVIGRPDVRAPLYGTLLGRDGIAHVLTVGKSNNTGSANLGRCRMAQLGQMPLDRELGTPPGDDYGSANSYHYGLAYATEGAGPYTAIQRATMPLVVAAYGKACGWTPLGTAQSCIGHGEATDRKVDPELDMGEMRRDTLAAHNAPPPIDPPAAPPVQEDDDMLKPFISEYPGAGQYLVTGDLTSRTGIASQADRDVLTGELGYEVHKLSASQLDRIPVVDATARGDLDTVVAQLQAIATALTP